MKKLISTFVSSLVLSASVLSGSAMAAGNASLSMSPASATYNVGTTFTASISENSGAETVNVVEADFSYDAGKIQFVSASCGGGFEIAAVVSANGITCGTTTPKSGSQSVGSVTFKAVANGTAPVNFTSGSAVYRSTDNTNIWNGNTSAATYTVTTPAAVAPVTPTTPKAKTVKTQSPTITSQPTPVATQTETPAATEDNEVLSADTNAQPVVVKDEASSKAPWVWSGIVVAVLAAAAGGYTMFQRKAASSAKKPVKRTV